jgi:hypothetical protein
MLFKSGQTHTTSSENKVLSAYNHCGFFKFLLGYAIVFRGIQSPHLANETGTV